MLYVSPCCRGRLPQVLVEYLWQLAKQARDAGNAQTQAFLLSPRRTGAGELQEIVVRAGNATGRRSVFGFSPVEAAVQVEWVAENAFMSLRGETV